MASDRSALSSTFASSKLEFYQQHDDTIRVRIYVSEKSFDYECIISAANWTSLKAALAGAGTSYNTGVLGPGGADHTVNVA